MINDEKLPDLTQKPDPAKPQADFLAGMDQHALMELRGRIDALLPPTTLAQVDLAHEILQQYNAAKTLQQRTSIDKEVPPNQKAQVLNSVTTILDHLLKMQT